MVVVEPPKIWKMNPKTSKNPLKDNARPTPSTIPSAIETTTMDRISKSTKRMIWFGEAPMACNTANSFCRWLSTSDRKTKLEATAATLATTN